MFALQSLIIDKVRQMPEAQLFFDSRIRTVLHNSSVDVLSTLLLPLIHRSPCCSAKAWGILTEITYFLVHPIFELF